MTAYPLNHSFASGLSSPGNLRHTNIICATSIANQKGLPRRIPSRMRMALVIEIKLRCGSTVRRNGWCPNRCEKLMSAFHVDPLSIGKIPAADIFDLPTGLLQGLSN